MLLNLKVNCIYFILFTGISCAPTNKEDESSRRIKKRQLFNTFIPNSEWFRLLRGNYPNDGIAKKFLGDNSEEKYIFYFPGDVYDESYTDYVDYYREHESKEDNSGPLEGVVIEANEETAEKLIPVSDIHINISKNEAMEMNTNLKDKSENKTISNTPIPTLYLSEYSNNKTASNKTDVTGNINLQATNNSLFVSKINDEISNETTQSTEFSPTENVFTSPVNVTETGILPLPNISVIPLDNVHSRGDIGLENVTQSDVKETKIQTKANATEVNNISALFLRNTINHIKEKRKNSTNPKSQETQSAIYNENLEKYLKSLNETLKPLKLTSNKPTNCSGKFQNKPKQFLSGKNDSKHNNCMQMVRNKAVTESPVYPNWSDIFVEKIVAYFIHKSLLSDAGKGRFPKIHNTPIYNLWKNVRSPVDSKQGKYMNINRNL